MYVESRKMVQMNLFAGRNRDADIETGYVGAEEGAHGEMGIAICALPCVKQTTSGHVLGGYCRELSSLLCNDPDG